MAGVNKAIVIGNLGRDPEIRHTTNGTAVCRLNVATTRNYMNKNTNERVEETEWHRISVWGKAAENCEKFLAKGRQVYVEGRLKTNKYTDKEGAERYSTEIVADTVQFLGGRGGDVDRAASGGGVGGGAGGGYGGYPEVGNGGGPGPTAPEDDDIPF